MSDNSKAIQHVGSVQKLDMVIHTRYPDCTPEQIAQIRERVLEYVMRCFTQGFELAFIKREGDQAILKILRMIEEEG